MPYENAVIIMGNITRDVELRYTPKGTAVCDVGVALNRVTRNEDGSKNEETTYVEVTLWGRQAEVANEYLQKGSPIYVRGRLATDSWDDKSTGQKRSKLKVVGEQLQLIGARMEKEANGAPSQEAPEPAPAAAAAATSAQPRSAKRAKPAASPQPALPDELEAEPDDVV